VLSFNRNTYQMSAKQITEKKKLTSKVTILNEIAAQLSQALSTLKESLGEKKFDKRIKKAAKLFAEGIKTSDPKKAPVTKSPSGKTKVIKAKVSSPHKKSAKSAPAK
jgi:hypothetical protein